MAGTADQRPPVFIVAPARRCGTTLLQRAFNSSSETIIYGENFVFLEAYPALLPGVVDNLPLKKARTRDVRNQVLGGHHDVDASAMFPDYEAYARLMREHLDRLAAYYREWSEEYGRSVWGLKHQIRRADSFAAFMRFFPAARYVFVYRNVFEVARSDRARFPQDYRRPEDFAALGRNWARNLEFMRSVKGANVLHLQYAELSQDIPQLVARLEAHCGVSGIKPEVFDRRINVSPIIDALNPGEVETGYRPPAALSPAEDDALRAVAEDPCRRFGYEVPAPARV